MARDEWLKALSAETVQVSEGVSAGKWRCEKIPVLWMKVSWWSIMADKAVEIVGSLQMDSFRCETAILYLILYITMNYWERL